MSYPNIYDVSRLIKQVGHQILVPTQGHKKGTDITRSIETHAEKALRNGLYDIAPFTPIYTKADIQKNPEAFAKQANREDALVITPLNGFDNFTQDGINYGTMIAYISLGETRQGHIFLPAQNILASALKGKGLDFAGGATQIRPRCSNAKDARIASCAQQTGDFYEGLPIGCYRQNAAQDYISLLKGDLDAVVFRSECSPWCIAAGDLIVEEGGGSVGLSRSNGTEYKATPTQEHDCVIVASSPMLVFNIRNHMRAKTPELCS